MFWRLWFKTGARTEGKRLFFNKQQGSKTDFPDVFLIKINGLLVAFCPGVDSKKRAQKFLEQSGFLPG